MPTKWLKERQDGSKNDVGMPPRRASRGLRNAQAGRGPRRGASWGKVCRVFGENFAGCLWQTLPFLWGNLTGCLAQALQIIWGRCCRLFGANVAGCLRLVFGTVCPGVQDTAPHSKLTVHPHTRPTHLGRVFWCTVSFGCGTVFDSRARWGRVEPG